MALGSSVPPASAAGGGEPFAFLLLPADARPAALGGAFAAVQGDPSALFYNPAGLAELERNAASFTNDRRFEGVSQQAFSVALRSGWALGGSYVGYGDIPRTTVSNQSGAGLGSFGAHDLALSAGYGRRMNAFLSAGAALKFVEGAIAGYSARGAAADLGARLELEPLWEIPLALGLSVSNLTLSHPRFANREEDFPTRLRLGAAWTADFGAQRVLALLDLERAGSDGFTFHPGVEWSPVEILAIRLGYDGRNDAGSGLTAGLGWRWRDLGIGYSFTPFGELGDSHRVSVSLRWGPLPGPRRTTRAPAPPVRKLPVRPAEPARPEPRRESPADPRELPAYFTSPKNIGG